MAAQSQQPLPAGQSAYNVNPGTQSGDGVFGGVPGAVGLPQPYSDLSHVFPNLSGVDATLSGQIASDLSGQVSPSVLQQVNSAANNAGISTAGMNLNNPVGTLGQTPEQLQSTGLKDYSSLLPVASQTQTVSPQVEAQLAEWNAQQAAQANPNIAGDVGTAMSAIGLIAALA